jgi:hypothetical protein
LLPISSKHFEGDYHCKVHHQKDADKGKKFTKGGSTMGIKKYPLKKRWVVKLWAK